MACVHTHTQVAREFGIEGGLDQFRITPQQCIQPVLLALVSASDKEKAHFIKDQDSLQGAGVCVQTMASQYSLEPKLITSISNFRSELLEDWRSIHFFVFDTTATEFDAWEAINVVVKHRRDHIRTRPAIVVLDKEESMTSNQR